jgi:hypothetical protein
MRNGRKRIRGKEREKVFKKDNYQCVFCGNESNLVIDHIIPLKYGGTNTVENYQTLCNKCNLKKRARLSDNLHKQVVIMSQKDRKGYERELNQLKKTVVENYTYTLRLQDKTLELQDRELNHLIETLKTLQNENISLIRL